jgi:hypothetical protein
VLAYRSTKSLSFERRELIKASEIETNEMIHGVLRGCIDAGLFRTGLNVELVAYHFVCMAHNWALKYWRLREITSFDDYVRQGFDFLAHALLTETGWASYRKLEAKLGAGGK